jgi:LmbE family N-acetylglucosaminyl deacetylase
MSREPLSWRESAFIPYDPQRHCPPGSALFLAPHPDDEVFGCGGAIMKHLAVGDEVKVIIVTDSSYGSFLPGEVGQSVRRRESQAAASVLGYGEPIYWGRGDRELVYDESLILSVVDALSETKAEILYAPSWWEVHPDHYVLALAAVEALRRCPRPIQLMMYEVGVPLHPNYLLDITELVNQKQKAMACFESQLKIQRYDLHLTALNRFRSYTLPPNVEYAEAYRLVRGEDLIQNPLQAIRPGLYYAQTHSVSALAQPLVSILFVGRPESLTDALDSVQLQTYPHIELIVVQDGYWGQYEPSGYLSQWREGRFPPRTIALTYATTFPERANVAMANAYGEWLLFLGDGDRLEPNHIAELMARVTPSGRTPCVCAGILLGNELCDSSPKKKVWQLAPEPRLPHSYASMPLCAGIFSRYLFEDGCRFNTQLETKMAIWEFWLQLACKSTWVSNPEVTACHRDSEPVGELGLTISPSWSNSPYRVIESWFTHCQPESVAEALWQGWQECERIQGENVVLNNKLLALESTLIVRQVAAGDSETDGMASEVSMTGIQYESSEHENTIQGQTRNGIPLKDAASLAMRHKLKTWLRAISRTSV